jgi:hypothetical protein
MIIGSVGIETKNDCADEASRNLAARESIELHRREICPTPRVEEYDHEYRGTQNQERICWRQTAAIYVRLLISVWLFLFPIFLFVAELK